MSDIEKVKRVEQLLLELPPPAGLRPATLADAPGLYDLYAAREQHFFGEVSSSLAEIEKMLQSTLMMSFVAESPTGEGLDLAASIGFASFSEFNGGGSLCSLDCDPDRAMAALRWVIDLARRSDPTKETTTSSTDKDTARIARLEELGGTIKRRWAEMVVPLDPDGAHAAPPDVPDNVQVRNLDGSDADWRIVYDVINTAFLDHFGNVGEDYESFVDGMKVWIDDWSICWVASVDGAPASVLLGETRPTDGFVATLGTLREFRKLGLGRLLLLTAFAEFAKRGFKKAALGVDQTNPTGAVGLYESVGMRMEQQSISYGWPPLEPADT